MVESIAFVQLDLGECLNPTFKLNMSASLCNDAPTGAVAVAAQRDGCERCLDLRIPKFGKHC